MKLLKYFILFTAILCALAYSSHSPTKKDLLQLHYQKLINEYAQKLMAFDRLIGLGSGDINHIRMSYLEMRTAYKKLEPLFEYYNPSLAKTYFNGAPLPKIDEGLDQLSVINPKGIQVIDEIVFDDSLKLPNENLKELSKDLTKIFSDFITAPLPNIQDREAFEALRLQLIRIFTLGITGFDTPASNNAIPDAINNLESSYKIIIIYIDDIATKDKSLAKQLQEVYLKAIQYLKKHPNFDTLDRAYFLKQYINPLYRMLYEAQMKLEIETSDEVSFRKKAVNYYAKNIFDVRFLNQDFYHSIPPNEVTKEVLKLGEILFFDPALSINNQRACASCHAPSKAFTDGRAKSIATNFDGVLLRNSPTLINSVYADRYFYDLRTDRLEDQIEHVLVNPKEFHTNYIELFEKLKQSNDYINLFVAAFPKHSQNPINKYTISSSLAAYVSRLTGLNSEFDRYIRGEQKTIASDVIRGFNLFTGKAGCATCHFSPIFNGTVPPYYSESESEVLGVPLENTKTNAKIDPDLGRANAKMREMANIYLHSFKTPTIRNIALTSPYMHNGVYTNLEEVLDFYNEGGGHGIGINLENQTLPTEKLGLSKKDMSDIIAFMNALTDTTGLTKQPKQLPQFPAHLNLNNRKIGGEY